MRRLQQSLEWSAGLLLCLMVIVGFDASGNPIVNDPAAASNDDVQRTYLRSEFEALWLSTSGGTVYLIFPEGTSTPDW